MKQLDLTSVAWQLEIPTQASVPTALRGRRIPARIPGCVHLDLIRAGCIQHPNLGFAELDNEWIGEIDWVYTCSFVADAALIRHETVELVCEGLDTVCALRLNGHPIGQAANMFHAHRFDLRGALRAGENRLSIEFVSPLRYIRQQEARLGARPVNGDWGAYVFIRKMACNFGWDWGPRTPTAGIWRPLRICAWNGTVLGDLRLVVARRSDDPELWNVTASVEVRPASTPGAGVRLTGRIFDGDATLCEESIDHAGTDPAHMQFTVRRPRTWWPRGLGAQPLYGLNLVCMDSHGKRLDRAERRFGFRTVTLRTDPDAHGRTFALVVNDRPIFCRGANWIPDSLFPAELTAERYRQRIGQAVAANMNMLRVWGGGIYEDEAFYDACDEQGVLVWQDFLFACGMYPEETPLYESVAQEARLVTSRLSHHPSVVLWCGGNECIWAHESWGFGARLRPGQTWGARYFHELLPRAVADLNVPYWPNSPYSGAAQIAPNDERYGNRHVWDTWGDGYRDTAPRFCSEFGHQSPPNQATLREAVAESELRVGSRAMEHRQRASGGNAVRYERPLETCFRRPREFDEWHFLAQLLAARSVATGIEWWRANRPRCMGVLFWQLNDVWAGHSWSAIDCAGRRKLLWYAVRRAFAPRAVSIQPLSGELRLVVHNDTDEACTGLAMVRRIALEGRLLARAEFPLEIAPQTWDTESKIEHWIGRPARPDRELVVADFSGLRATWFYASDRALIYPAPRFRGMVERSGAGCGIRITAESLLRDLSFQLDRVGASLEAEEQLLTLLPGESAVIPVRGELPSSADVFSRPVMWCANEFGSTG